MVRISAAVLVLFLTIAASSPGSPIAPPEPFTIESAGHSELNVGWGFASPRVEPGAELTWPLSVYNGSESVADGLQLRIVLPAGSTFLALTESAHWTCDANGNTALCRRTEPLQPHSGDSLGVRFLMSGDPSGGRRRLDATLIIGASVVASNSFNVEVYRIWRVTSTEDSGEGSLRQAVDEVNDQCRSDVPIRRPGGPICRIVFDLPPPVPASGWFTIQPRQPLIVTVSDIAIDATTQTAATGDTNPDGPEVELDGSLQAEGSGIEIGASCELQIRGLAIHSFPEDGIRVSETAAFGCQQWENPIPIERAIADNHLGTDPRGIFERGNGLRGISSIALGYVHLSIRRNLISGNRRSGIFIWQGNGYQITGNRIGTRRDEVLPLPNGASGVYVSEMADLILIQDNFITFNEHWGVALDVSNHPRARKLVQIGPNVIHSNHNPAIDLRLDLKLVQEGDPAPLIRPPVIRSAVYDAVTDTTTIEGIAPQTATITDWQRFVVDVYSSTNVGPYGHGEAERHIGRVTLTTEPTFLLVVPGELTGRFISATITLLDLHAGNGSTSEVSRPVQATR